ncbi:protein required for attachment to host cells [Novosphingobium kunmingense]|uniref:Protein required for attachment to host cells n=1 Tax=Novosphingobium kunmingense TaxID=1211806 RepID=A0A2N0I1S4_9SPHN|nr:host attachment protein [Novosphingobium kunmingense]PKB25137.1 protein required for attachment to host cells [Novosphingobium kunmingense]
MLLPHGAVIALIDGARFELYRNAGTEAAPELAALDAPRLDSRNHSGGSHRSSTGNHADSLVREDAHALAAADWLNSKVLDHTIKDLVLIAPPRTLGELRKHVHKLTAQVIGKEIAKDLVGRPVAEVVAALREVH